MLASKFSVVNIMRSNYQLIPLLFIIYSLSCAFAQAKPLLIHHIKGYTITGDKLYNSHLKKFDALLIDKGKILATGKYQQLHQQAPKAKLYDGQGKTLLPGLIDSHGHISGQGISMIQVDLRGKASLQSTREAIKAYATKFTGFQWIRGRGWNQVLWSDTNKQFPRATDIDKVVKQRPVWLQRIDGHAGWANSRALALAGITKATKAPAGGEIIRDAHGNPTGILIDNAMDLVTKIMPKYTEKEIEQSLQLAFKHIASFGITSVHDMDLSFRDYNVYKKLMTNKALPIRIYGVLSNDPNRMPIDKLDTILKAGRLRSNDDKLSIRGVKLYADGALGSRGAALLSPYSDKSSHEGLMRATTSEFENLYKKIIGAGFQISIHAIGDKGNRVALNVFEKVFKQINGKHLRHRIEHAQVVALEDIPRFNKLNIIASMQPIHAISDMNMAEDRVGAQRIKGAYAWRRFLSQGVRIAAGSDFPVELVNPFLGMHAAITRQNTQNKPSNGWQIQQAMSLEETLRAFTLDAAYAAHQEKTLGSIEAGKWADFILVDRDIFNINPKDLWKTKVLETWVAGQQIYQAW